jgi:hypothetical protein
VGWISASALTCVTPRATAVGSARVQVTVAGQANSGAAPALFAFTEHPPALVALEPSSGPATPHGGLPITLRGTGLQAVKGVQFGEFACELEEEEGSGEDLEGGAEEAVVCRLWYAIGARLPLQLLLYRSGLPRICHVPCPVRSIPSSRSSSSSFCLPSSV